MNRSNVKQLLESCHIRVSDDWLADCLQFLSNQPSIQHELPEGAERRVYEQWLAHDLSETGAAESLPLVLNETQRVQRLQGPFVVQLRSVLDCGSSALSQYHRVAKVDNRNVEITTSADQEVKPWEPKPKRMLMLELTDARGTLVKAMEYKPLTALHESTPPGAKLLLHGEIICRRGLLFLHDGNTTVLGGCVEELAAVYSLKNRLERILNKPLTTSAASDGENDGPASTVMIPRAVGINRTDQPTYAAPLTTSNVVNTTAAVTTERARPRLPTLNHNTTYNNSSQYQPRPPPMPIRALPPIYPSNSGTTTRMNDRTEGQNRRSSTFRSSAVRAAMVHPQTQPIASQLTSYPPRHAIKPPTTIQPQRHAPPPVTMVPHRDRQLFENDDDYAADSVLDDIDDDCIPLEETQPPSPFANRWQQQQHHQTQLMSSSSATDHFGDIDRLANSTDDSIIIDEDGDVFANNNIGAMHNDNSDSEMFGDDGENSFVSTDEPFRNAVSDSIEFHEDISPPAYQGVGSSLPYDPTATITSILSAINQANTVESNLRTMRCVIMTITRRLSNDGGSCWSMAALLNDGSGVIVAEFDHRLLQELIGYNAADAQDIIAHGGDAAKTEANERMLRFKSFLQRLDLLFKIEFRPSALNRPHVVKSLRAVTDCE